MTLEVSVNSLQNKERYLNEEILSKVNGQRKLEDITLNNKLVLQFSDNECKGAKTVVKQFSKKKYESFEAAIFAFRSKTPKYEVEREKWRLVYIVEFSRDWLVFFTKNI